MQRFDERSIEQQAAAHFVGLDVYAFCTQGYALARFTLGFMLAPASQAED